MSILASLFGGRRKAEAELIATIITGEIERRKIDAEVASKDREIRLREKELELEHLESISEQRRKDAAARDELREQRRKWAANAREKLHQKRNQEAAQASGTAQSECAVCKNPNNPHLPAALILAHYANGHAVPPALAQ